MNIRNSVCGMFDLYKLIYAIYQTIIIGILPPLLMSIFSILAIRSLHQRHDVWRRFKQRDRYLMRMVMAEVILNVFISIPYSINLAYGVGTYYDVDKSARRLEIEAFITFVTQFIIYLRCCSFLFISLDIKTISKRMYQYIHQVLEEMRGTASSNRSIERAK